MTDLETKTWQGLKTVIDPELGINIVDLGLIYKVEETDKQGIFVRMTLTTPGCPLAPYFQEQVPAMIQQATGLSEEEVELKFVFDPPWVQDMMSEEAKAELGFD